MVITPHMLNRYVSELSKTNLLHGTDRVLDELIVPKVVNKFPAFNETRRVIAFLKIVRKVSVSSARSFHFRLS